MGVPPCAFKAAMRSSSLTAAMCSSRARIAAACNWAEATGPATTPGTLVVNDSNATAGSLTAEGGDDGAGMGPAGTGADPPPAASGQNLSSGSLPAGWKAVGSITINGGTITAVGKRGGAGIGGGSLTSAGDIAINGGVVTATASGTARYDYISHNVEAMGGAGIGSGAGWGFWIRSGYNRTATVTCGKIAISEARSRPPVQGCLRALEAHPASARVTA